MHKIVVNIASFHGYVCSTFRQERREESRGKEIREGEKAKRKCRKRGKEMRQVESKQRRWPEKGGRHGKHWQVCKKDIVLIPYLQPILFK